MHFDTCGCAIMGTPPETVHRTLCPVRLASRRGFARLSDEERRALASKGGKRAHEKGTARQWDRDSASQAGYRGGVKVSQDREHMRAIGRRGAAALQAKRREGAEGA